MVLVIDNYDSFTYNLVQYLQMLGAQVEVRRNDEASLDALRQLNPSHLLISPGPGRPEQAGLSLAAIDYFSGKIPILGVCLGMQAIAWRSGAQIVHAPTIMHGKASQISHYGNGLFASLPSPLQVARYHSLVVAGDTLGADWQITAATADDERVVMALAHRQLPIFGVQFHPEAILSEGGLALLANFLRQ